METILLIIAISTLNAVCFFIGASIRQKVDKGEELKMPNINPVDLYHEHKEKEAQDKKARQREAIIRNIEKYDGTSLGQEDIPR